MPDSSVRLACARCLAERTHPSGAGRSRAISAAISPIRSSEFILMIYKTGQRSGIFPDRNPEPHSG